MTVDSPWPEIEAWAEQQIALFGVYLAIKLLIQKVISLAGSAFPKHELSTMSVIPV